MGIESNNSIDEVKENNKQNEKSIDENQYKNIREKIKGLELRDKDEIQEDLIKYIEDSEELDHRIKTGTLEVSDIENNISKISVNKYLEGINGTPIEDKLKNTPIEKIKEMNPEMVSFGENTYYIISVKRGQKMYSYGTGESGINFRFNGEINIDTYNKKLEEYKKLTPKELKDNNYKAEGIRNIPILYTRNNLLEYITKTINDNI